MSHERSPETRSPGPSANRCGVCGKPFAASELVPLALTRQGVADAVRAEHPEIGLEAMVCRNDLHRYRTRYIEEVLERDRGELTALEREVLDSLERHETLARDVEGQFKAGRSLGERVADRVATFGGSWAFIGTFFFFIAAWIAVNAVAAARQVFDPYPFILLNLILSCLAAIQAPIIMMSQNRQEAKDRLRAEQDYRVNLKAELEIRHLHSKMDQLLSHQWQRLLEIQQMQTEMLAEIAERAGREGPRTRG